MKGVDPIIAVVLLIAVTVLLSAIVLSWITALTKEEGATISNKTTSCSMADLSIAEVYIDLSANRGRVAVRNSGFADDILVSAVLLNVQGDAATNLTAFPISFPVGSLQTIVFNTTGKITACGNFSKVIVSTQCASDESRGTPKCV